MTLTIDDMASELETMVPVASEAEGIANFAQAFEGYFYGATVSGVEVTEGTLAPCTAAMRAAMTGVGKTGAPAITNGVVAFWSALAGITATVWIVAPPLATVTVPPNLGALTLAISSVAKTNIEGGVSIEEAARNMAEVIHPLNLGGLAVNTSAPPVSIPIL